MRVQSDVGAVGRGGIGRALGTSVVCTVAIERP
jgi:hypothetical protein